MSKNTTSPNVTTLEEANKIWPKVNLSKKCKDLTNQSFNQLTCLYPTKINNSIKRWWVCKCNCGKYTAGETYSITSGRKQSCGCNVTRIRRDLVGQQFDKLRVISLDESFEKIRQSGQHHYWLCQCECGNIISIAENDLLRNNRHHYSCGCTTFIIASYQENRLNELLKKYKINYSREYKFLNLKDKTYLRFDFAIYDNQHHLLGLIEYQGEQHTNTADKYFSNKTIEHDKMKKDYCKLKNIPLFEIWYYESKNMEEKLITILKELKVWD